MGPNFEILQNKWTIKLILRHRPKKLEPMEVNSRQYHCQWKDNHNIVWFFLDRTTNLWTKVFHCLLRLKDLHPHYTQRNNWLDQSRVLEDHPTSIRGNDRFNFTRHANSLEHHSQHAWIIGIAHQRLATTEVAQSFTTIYKLTMLSCQWHIGLFPNSTGQVLVKDQCVQYKRADGKLYGLDQLLDGVETPREGDWSRSKGAWPGIHGRLTKDQTSIG